MLLIEVSSIKIIEDTQIPAETEQAVLMLAAEESALTDVGIQV